MSTQYLNLDDVLVAEKVVKIGGVEHPVLPVSVEHFIEQIKIAQEMQKKGDDFSLVDEVNTGVDFLHRSIPTLSKDYLRSMPIEKLNALSAFVQDQDGTNFVKKAAEAEAEETKSADPQ